MASLFKGRNFANAFGLKYSESQLVKTLSEIIGDGLTAPRVEKVHENITAGKYGVINIQTDEDLLKFYNHVKNFKNLSESTKVNLMNEWNSAAVKININQAVLKTGSHVLKPYRLREPVTPVNNPDDEVDVPMNPVGGRRSRKNKSRKNKSRKNKSRKNKSRKNKSRASRK